MSDKEKIEQEAQIEATPTEKKDVNSELKPE